ncbi:MAG: hypothetical protein R2739_04995 [Chitinophagales bacterium]
MEQEIDRQKIIRLIPDITEDDLQNSILRYEEASDIVSIIFSPHEPTANIDWEDNKPNILYHYTPDDYLKCITIAKFSTL